MFTDSVKVGVQNRSNFDLSHIGVGSTDFGDLLPVFLEDVVPSDSLQIDFSTFMRLAPMVLPTYGRIHGYINFFFVPERLICRDWQNQITGGSTGTYPVDFPAVNPKSVAEQFSSYWNHTANYKRATKLANAFGIPYDFHGDDAPSLDRENAPCFDPWLVYNKIYAEYYAPIDLMNDDNFEDRYAQKLRGFFTDNIIEAVGRQTGFNLPRDFFLMKKTCYNKDYFNTLFTRPQRGQQALVPVNSVGDGFRISGSGRIEGFTSSGAFALGGGTLDFFDASTGSFTGITLNQFNPAEDDLTFSAIDGLRANADQLLSNISTYTLRNANALQRFLERNNVSGARYLEQMLARFGVKIAAERLDRAEWIGGKDFFVSIGDVTATANTETNSGETFLGQQAGKGIGDGSISVSYTAKEHGWIIGLMHILPDTKGSVQGLPKKFTRRYREDYFTPEYEDTGLQPVYNREIYCFGVNRNGVFGYGPRYGEYKFGNDVLFGDIAHPEDGTAYGNNTASAWHLFRLYDQQPVLNSAFPVIDAETNGGFDRIFQITDVQKDHFYLYNQIRVSASRPMSGFAESALAFANEQGSGRVNLSYGGTRL